MTTPPTEAALEVSDRVQNDAVREALKAIELAERTAGRFPEPDGQTISLTPHGWEFIYRAFDMARDALATPPAPVERDLLANRSALIAGCHVPNLIDNLRETAIGCDHSNEASLAELCNCAADVIAALAATPGEEGARGDVVPKTGGNAHA